MNRNSAEMLAFKSAAKTCLLAGATYRELRDALATEDELTPLNERKRDAKDAGDDPISKGCQQG